MVETVEPVVEITVYGEAKSAGSKRAFKNPKTGKIIVTEAVKGSKSWKQEVSSAALAAYSGHVLDDAIDVDLTFYRTRPASHFGSGKNRNYVKDSAPAHPNTRPDVDKLSRGVLDALKGIVWTDDARIVTKTARKRFAEHDYCEIRVFLSARQTAKDLPLEQRVRGDGPVQETLAA